MSLNRTSQAFPASPFVKWAGGKGQLISQLEVCLPSDMGEKPFTYIEPFVGGGAMMFFMLQRFPCIRRVVINDINRHLATAYRVIKEKPDTLILNLKRIEKDYKSLGTEEARKAYYLELRRMFNEEEMDAIGRTSLLLFLNRTCFNGLYRENSRGRFNVPFGRYENPTICNAEVIHADSELLNLFNVEILCGDFEVTLDKIDESGPNFFYFDPPYRPLSATSNFNSYVKEGFNDNEQRRLAMSCHKLSRHPNVLWMLSNADCSSTNTNDRFFEKLYRGFDIQRVWASRSVNAIASKRGKLSELLIRNYEKGKNIYKVAEEEASYN